MKRFYTLILAALLLPMSLMAQGWPDNYSGVMLQGFYWDSYIKSKWTKLEGQTGDFKGYFDLVWVPQSGKCLNSNSMGYDPYYYFNQNSSFGTEQELRSMISTFKANGIGTIADVVINHHNTDGWWGFPAETYKGVTYQLKTTDIVADDCNGKTAAQAAIDGVTLSPNPDEGEGWAGMRDLDHKSANVQNIVKAYQKFLLEDLGYAGFRYDMVKGFWASHVRDYNDAAGVKFSVGEFWDGSGKIKEWINYTERRSAAFDFDFKYTVTNAANSGYWSNLGNQNGGNWPMVSNNSDQSYYRYAVTFVENHDTEKRANGDSNGPLEKDTLAANAFLLAMPGTPCVFYKHYLAYPNEIKAMIDARKAAGITNTGSYSNYRSAAGYFGNVVTGSKGKLLVMVGSNYSEPAANRYVKILSGHHYAYYLSPETEVAFADKPSGTYVGPFNTKLTAVSANSGAKLVYTTNGSTPSATNGKVVASGASITISDDCTLKVGLLVNGNVTATTTRNYTFDKPENETFETPPAGYTFSANFIAPASWDKDIEVYAWAWGTNTNYTPDDKANWPGDKEHVYRVGRSKDGGYIWKWCYYGEKTVAPSYIIFNNGSGGDRNKTKDMVFTDKGWYNMSTTQSDPTLDIKGVTQTPVTNSAWYTLTGVKVAAPTQKGIYIHNGKKVIIK